MSVFQMKCAAPMYQLKGLPRVSWRHGCPRGTLIVFLGIEVEPRSGHLLQTTLLMVAQRSTSRSFKSDFLPLVLLEVNCCAGFHDLVMTLASFHCLWCLFSVPTLEAGLPYSRGHIVTKEKPSHYATIQGFQLFILIRTLPAHI